jgi:hypothetical protein
MMEKAEKLALLNTSLERAADQLGDVTAPIMALYYRRYPEAEAAFERLSIGDKPQLEGGMVENTLYCAMTWLESQAEVEIMLWHTTPHHEHTLDIRLEWFTGFADALIDVIAQTIPPECRGELAVWEEIRTGLISTMTEAATDRRIAA